MKTTGPRKQPNPTDAKMRPSVKGWSPSRCMEGISENLTFRTSAAIQMRAPLALIITSHDTSLHRQDHHRRSGHQTSCRMSPGSGIGSHQWKISWTGVKLHLAMSKCQASWGLTAFVLHLWPRPWPQPINLMDANWSVQSG